MCHYKGLVPFFSELLLLLHSLLQNPNLFSTGFQAFMLVCAILFVPYELKEDMHHVTAHLSVNNT